MLSRGETFPTMDLVFEEKMKDTNPTNGTKVVIPLKDSSDASRFISAINRQLTYFPNVVFKSFDNIGSVTKSKTILETEDFIIDSNSSTAGILIGNVQYPINSALLNNKFVPGIGIKYKFNIGVLDLVPSREAIRYTDNTKKMILEKMSRVEDYAQTQIKTKFATETNFISLLVKIEEAHYAQRYGRNNYRYSYNQNNSPKMTEEQEVFNHLCYCLPTLNLGKVKFKDLEFSMKDGINWAELFCGLEFNQVYDYGTKSKRQEIRDIKLLTGKIYKIVNCFYRSKDLVIFETDKQFYTVKERDIVLEPKNFTSTKEYQTRLKELTDLNILVKKYFYEAVTLEDYDAIVPKLSVTAKNVIDWEAERKRNGEIFFRHLTNDNRGRRHRYSGQFSWSNNQKKLNDIKFETIIYGYDDDSEKLEFMVQMYNNDVIQLTNVWKIAKANKKYFENSTHVDDFFDKENPKLKEFYTLHQNSGFIRAKKYLRNFKPFNSKIHNLFKELETKLDKLHAYSDELEKKLLKYCNCDKKDLIDDQIIDKLEILKEYTKDLDLLAFIPELSSWSYNTNLPKDLIPGIEQFLAFCKKEMN